MELQEVAQIGDAPIEGACVLLSGGIDSTTVLHYVRKELGVQNIHALSFVYGQKHSRELEMARHQAGQVQVTCHREIDISFLGGLAGERSALTAKGCPVPDLADIDEASRRQPPTYVPHRNLVLLALAASAAEGAGLQHLFYGAQAQDEYGYWDCTEAFIGGLNNVLALNRARAVHVHAPFVSSAKSEIIKIGLALGVDYSHTWTCYRGGEVSCETCPSCVERARAFEVAGVVDPLGL